MYRLDCGFAFDLWDEKRIMIYLSIRVSELDKSFKNKNRIQLAGYLSLIDKSISMFSSIWLDEKDSVSFSDVYKPVALSFNCCASSSVS